MVAIFNSANENPALTKKDIKKLRLIWLEQNEFSKLKENEVALEDVWNKMLSEIKPYFVGYELPFSTVVQNLSNITVTSDMRFPCYFSPATDSLTFELASFFFIGNVANEFASATPPWFTAGKIVHELNHRLFFHERDMIMKEQKQYEEFEKQHLFEAEIQARLAQIKFLEHCRYNVPTIDTSFKIIISEWIENGKDFKHKFEPLRLSKEDTIFSIDNAIRYTSFELAQIKEGKYGKAVEKSNLIIDELAKILLLPKPNSGQQSTFPIKIRISKGNRI